MSTVLVTGGTGFLGANLVHGLVAAGHRVRILRRSHSDLRGLEGAEVEHVIGDVRDPVTVRKAVTGCDIVFHTAAIVSYWRKERSEMFSVNVGGTRAVVDACVSAGVRRLIHTSSIAAIGFTTDGSPSTEQTPYNWAWFDVGYRDSKHQAEEVVLEGVRRGLDAVIVNPSVIMGPRDLHMHGGRIVRDIYRKRIFYATAGGTSIVDVRDVVSGMMAAAERGRTGERYLLAGENASFAEIFRLTADVVGGWAPGLVIPGPVVTAIAATVEALSGLLRVRPWVTRELVAGLGIRRVYSTDKARRELGFSARPLRETISATFDWYRAQGLL